jgi:hypothetical protein
MNASKPAWRVVPQPAVFVRALGDLLKDKAGIIPGAAIVGVNCLAIALVAPMGLEERHGKDLDCHEVI